MRGICLLHSRFEGASSPYSHSSLSWSDGALTRQLSFTFPPVSFKPSAQAYIFEKAWIRICPDQPEMFIAHTSANPHLAAFVKLVDVHPVHLNSIKLPLHLSLLSNLRPRSPIMLSTVRACPAPSSTLPPFLESFALSTHGLFKDDQRPTQAFRDTVKLVICGKAALWFLTREATPFPSCRYLYVRWSGSDDDRAGLLHAPPDCSSIECLRWDLTIPLHQISPITMSFPSLRVFRATVPFDGKIL